MHELFKRASSLAKLEECQRFATSKHHKTPSWATVDAYTFSGHKSHQLQNLVQGHWKDTQKYSDVVDPLNGEKFIRSPETTVEEAKDFIHSLKECPKSGKHNVFKNPERYVLWGDICRSIAEEMRKPDVEDYLTKLIERVMPKSYVEAKGEVVVTRKFFENFSGDNIRFLVEGEQVAGDHAGQRSTGYRWPYGPVAIISPFNFPLEIPALQLFGSLIVGNKPVLKAAEKVSIVMEEFLRLSIHAGMPADEVDFLNGGHHVVEHVIKHGGVRLTQFTGGAYGADQITKLMHGKVRLEDAGFDWKVFGPDVFDIDYVAWESDEDAYAASGQKCSAQSIAYVHKNWSRAGLLEKLKALAAKRKLEDLTVGPILSLKNKEIKEHIDKLLQIPGARVLFGGRELTGHKIPECYGAYEPTAVFVPIEQINKNHELVTTEIFGPFQIISEYEDAQLDLVLEELEGMSHHLTAGIVSNDQQFLDKVVANTVNGVTYAGIRARTTGAPQNHWFGPTGDPRGAGIGSPYAITHVWTSHREIITDYGPIPNNWKTPNPT